MGRALLVNSIRFFILIATQVFLLKNIGYYNLSIPYLYVLFILLLPFGIPNGLLFLLSFLTGLSVDIFYDTLGLNALACTVMAFVRVLFISLTVQRDGFDNGLQVVYFLRNNLDILSPPDFIQFRNI